MHRRDLGDLAAQWNSCRHLPGDDPWTGTIRLSNFTGTTTFIAQTKTSDWWGGIDSSPSSKCWLNSSLSIGTVMVKVSATVVLKTARYWIAWSDPMRKSNVAGDAEDTAEIQRLVQARAHYSQGFLPGEEVFVVAITARWRAIGESRPTNRSRAILPRIHGVSLRSLRSSGVTGQCNDLDPVRTLADIEMRQFRNAPVCSSMS